MNEQADLPRVLIVYPMCLNRADQHGLSLRSWFANWPREKLAQIYSGGEVGTERFCSNNFRLGPRERRWGEVFFRLKESSLGEAGFPVFSCSETMAVQRSFGSRLKRWVAQGLLNSGLWELLFRPVLSPEMEKWVQEFDPQVIYCQGYSLSFAWLPLLLHHRFGVPFCFQTGDDWPRNLYRDTPVSWLVRPVVKKAAEELISSAAVRFANGQEMVEEYSARYGVSFEAMMMCDEEERFSTAEPRRLVGEGIISILYAGSLGSGRCAPLLDLCQAVKKIIPGSHEFKVFALASGIPTQGLGRLAEQDNLSILPAPSHEELPSYLKGADILFLPESFENHQAQSIALSISSKAHLYMMSGRPILVYGPPQAGSVKYARKEKWACVVDRPGVAALQKALEKLVSDVGYRQMLVAHGRDVAQRNHNSLRVKGEIRRRFEKLTTEGHT